MKSISPQRFIANFDWALFGLMITACCCGLLVIYSADYRPETGESLKWKQQAISMGVGLLAYLISAFISLNFVRRWAWIIYALGCSSLVGILLFGEVAGGARRWLSVASFRMQPSEFMKLAMILALARFLSRDTQPRGGYDFKSLLLPIGIVLLPFALVIDQPDLGTALATGLVGGTMILFAGVQRGTLIRVALIGLTIVPCGWFFLKEYQRNRLLTFLTPELDPMGIGYHVLQSKIAVGSGALTGKGFLQGTQTQLRFLPEQTTDFLFSVLSEEWGFIGTVSVLVLYLCLILKVIGVANRCGDRFPAFICVGVGAMLFWQSFINAGMVIGVLPVVGITFPLLSFGGSSVITVMAGLGFVAGINARRFLFS